MASSRVMRSDQTTLEMCMTRIDREKTVMFVKNLGGVSKMTKMSKINEILLCLEICDFEFDPCGYSVNGIEGAPYSTVHVTPEDGFNYAS